MRSGTVSRQRKEATRGNSQAVDIDLHHLRKDSSLTDDERRTHMNEVLLLRGLPVPPGDRVTDARWIAGLDDWWARTDLGWFWFDPTKKTWKSAPNGPP